MEKSKKTSDNDKIDLSERLKILSISLDTSFAQIAHKAHLGKPDILYHVINGNGNYSLSFKTIWKIIHAYPQTNANFLFGTETNPLRTNIEKKEDIASKLDCKIQIFSTFKEAGLLTQP